LTVSYKWLVFEDFPKRRAGKMHHLDVLKARAQYLAARVEAKQKVGWEFQWDERERAALEWAITRLARLSEQDNTS
jgi:hypothetical protein